MNKPDFSKNRVLIVGDVMLDKYYYGTVKRISPEAPVPVVNVKRTVYSLGGAANVSNNVLGLGAQPVLIGVAGKDSDKDVLCSILDDKRIEHTIFESAAPTTTKVRVIGEHQQVARLDFEERHEIGESACRDVMEVAGQLMPDVNVVVISDYDKGFCCEDVCRSIIALATRYSIPVIVDPKGRDWHKYSGADMLTPNVRELGEVLGFDMSNSNSEIEKYGREIANTYRLKSLLITRSEKGMSLLNSERAIHMPTEAREVFDVTGAGDTVIGTVAVALANGIDEKDAVLLANKAAGIVVNKLGTSPILHEELFGTAGLKPGSKIVAPEELADYVRRIKGEKKKIVFTNGCFDILHKGHVAYLRESKRYGDVLVVGINSDGSVRRLKGDSRPVNNQADRAEIVSSLEFVDFVTVFDEDTPINLVRTIMPDFLIKGGDYTPEEVAGREYAGEVIILPYLENYSTSGIIERMHYQ